MVCMRLAHSKPKLVANDTPVSSSTTVSVLNHDIPPSDPEIVLSVSVDVWALLKDRKYSSEFEEDEESDSEDDVSKDDTRTADLGLKSEPMSKAEGNPELEPQPKPGPGPECPKVIRSFKPTSARDPRALRKNAASTNLKDMMRIGVYGPWFPKGKSGTSIFMAASSQSKPSPPLLTNENKSHASLIPGKSCKIQQTPQEEEHLSTVDVLAPTFFQAVGDQIKNPRVDGEENHQSYGPPLDVLKHTTFKLADSNYSNPEMSIAKKPKSDSKSENVTIKQEELTSDFETDTTNSKQQRLSSVAHIASAGSRSTMSSIWAPYSHKPIYLGEPGHGVYKSRVVFEADFIPLDQRYDYGMPKGRMTALEKFQTWRDKEVAKLKDGSLRQVERLVILNEGLQIHYLSTSQLVQYSEKLARLGRMFLPKFMPDSFIVFRFAFPPANRIATTWFGGFIEALSKLIEQFPYHFSVEVQGDVDSIRGVNRVVDAFVSDLAFFHQHGNIPRLDGIAFKSMKQKKKHDKRTIVVEREARAAAAFLPWISEGFAREYYEKVSANPDQDFGPLELDQTKMSPTALMSQEDISITAPMNRF